MKKFFRILLILVCALALLVVVCDLRVRNAARGRLYDDVQSVPHEHAALLLGTSSRLRGGSPNPFFENRMDAAAELFRAGKVDCILVSGDNRLASYNEPMAMRKALLERNVPDSLIFLDYAGFRTLDSVVRACEVFGQTSYIVVSQRFHNERAVYLAKRHGIAAMGYNAADVHAPGAFRVRAREVLARVSACWDVLTGRGPHFLGDKIEM